MYEHIQVTPADGALGAEIGGVDLARLAPAAFAEIRAAFIEHQVVVFRGQRLGVAEHKAFGARFGDLYVHPLHQPMKAQGHPEVVVMESSAEAPSVAERWHSDVSFEERPALGSVLRARVVPAAGGDTLWASTRAAYEALDPAMQRRLSGLEAVHDGVGFERALAAAGKPSAKRLTAVHPVVRTHPESGRKALYVNPVFTTRVVGMPSAEGRALLDALFRHIDNPAFHFRLRWQPDTVAMWDNRCTVHRVDPRGLAARRRMERVMIVGDRPAA